MNRANATDQSSIEAARTAQATQDKLAMQNDIEDVRRLMGSKWGRRFVWRLLSKAGVFRPSFNVNAMTMAFNEGYRKFGTELLEQIHLHALEQHDLMVKENTGDR